MNRIKKIQIENTIYNVNTDFRVAIRCFEIINDNKIGDYERVLGIICTLFGVNAIDNPNHYEKLLKWAKNYLSCGKEIEASNEKPDMDYVKDKNLIISSFKYDYKYNPYQKKYLSWEEFFNDLNNLSNNIELGNCCVLSRARYWRNFDISKIKDPKEQANAIKIKKYYALDNEEKEIKFTKSQQQSVDEFYKSLGF